MVDSWARSPLWVVTISCRLCLICNSLQLDCFLSFSCKLDNLTHPEADCWLFCFIFRILGCNYSGNLSHWFRKFQMGHELAESGMTTGPIWHLFLFSFLQTNTFFSRFDFDYFKLETSHFWRWFILKIQKLIARNQYI